LGSAVGVASSTWSGTSAGVVKVANTGSEAGTGSVESVTIGVVSGGDTVVVGSAVVI